MARRCVKRVRRCGSSTLGGGLTATLSVSVGMIGHRLSGCVMASFLLGKHHRLETACDRKEHTRTDGQAHRRRLLWHDRRVLGCRDGYGSGTPVVELNHHMGFAAP